MSTKLKYSLFIGVLLLIGAIVSTQLAWDSATQSGEEVKPKELEAVSRVKQWLAEDFNIVTYKEIIVEIDEAVRKEAKYSPAELREIIAYLRVKPASYPLEQWHEHSNSLLNLLQVQREPKVATEVTDLLLYLAEDVDDPAIQLYGVQHYRNWYLNNATQSDQVRLKDSLIYLLNSPQAGTALKVLSDLQIGASDIDERSIVIAADTKFAEDVRISAIHLSCERNNSRILPMARLIAVSRDTHTQLRKAAVFSIGEFGDKSDLNYLSTIGSESPRLKKAVQLAHKKITQR